MKCYANVSLSDQDSKIRGFIRLFVLAVFVVMDYISGVVAASTESGLSSNKGLIGIARKVFIFAVVCVAHQVDTVLGDQHMLRDATMYFYMANESLSIVENVGRIGVPLPPKLIKAIAVLKDKGGAKHGD